MIDIDSDLFSAGNADDFRPFVSCGICITNYTAVHCGFTTVRLTLITISDKLSKCT